MPQKHQSLGKEHDRWLVRLRPAVKENPSCVVRVKNKRPVEGGLLPGFTLEVINGESREMLCKTITGFSSGLARVPNVATANETGNVDGCFIEAPASAKQAGVLHRVALTLVISC